MPLAAHAQILGEHMFLRAFIALPDGTRIVRAEARGLAHQGAAISQSVVEQLRAQDAAAILAQCLQETGI